MAVGIRIKLPGVKVDEFDQVDAAIDVSVQPEIAEFPVHEYVSR